MRKTIELSNGAVTLESNAATPLIAKRIFGIDYFAYFQNAGSGELADSTTNLMKLAFVMAKQAEVSARISGASEQLNELFKLKEEDFVAWSMGIEFNEMASTLLPFAMQVWAGNNETSSTSKNQQDRQ